jgi:hypothetical protein
LDFFSWIVLCLGLGLGGFLGCWVGGDAGAFSRLLDYWVLCWFLGIPVIFWEIQGID